MTHNWFHQCLFWKGRGVRAERREERVKVLGECPRLQGGPLLQGHRCTGPGDLWILEAPGQGRGMTNSPVRWLMWRWSLCVSQKCTQAKFSPFKNLLNPHHVLHFCPLHCLRCSKVYLYLTSSLPTPGSLLPSSYFPIESILLKVINLNPQVYLSPLPSQHLFS